MIQARVRLGSNKRLDRLHRDVLSAMDSALGAADPRNIIRSHLKLERNTLHVASYSYPLTRFHKILVVGAGKASGYMGEEVERLLGNRITGGLVTVPEYLRPWPSGFRIKYRSGTHPIPSEENVQGMIETLELVKDSGPQDLVIVLLSGGASALMDYPIKGVSLQDEKRTTDILLKSGARIQEINTVRKHLSRVKGGRLAEILRGVNLLTLIISDVVGDQLDAIGSGPTLPDPTTYRDARQILEKYSLWSKAPPDVRRVVEKGIMGVIPETAKGDGAFRRVRNVVVGSNKESCRAAASYLRDKGYNSQVLSTRIVGEARDVGRILGSIILDKDNGLSLPPAALVAGGETTVRVTGKGKGGRNQELALAAAITIDGSDGLAMGSIGTDGVDGPTDAAGALIDGTTVARGRKRGMDPEAYLEDNDSYSYFSRLGDLVKTGATGTNVNDVMIAASK